MASVYIILPAAGLGTRMLSSGLAPKQFLLLGGKPILIHTLRTFAGLAQLRGVFIAVRPGERARLEALLAEERSLLPKDFPITIVEGGDTRQDSVSRALASIACGDDDIVLVHDAVRPLVEPSICERTVAAIERWGAAIVGLPAVDTIKQVTRTADGALITATLPRENIVLAQTPQGARAAALRRAFAEAEADGFAGTDEASLLERAGVSVAVVPGSPSNLKITQAADLPLAEWYLAQRGTTIQGGTQ